MKTPQKRVSEAAALAKALYKVMHKYNAQFVECRQFVPFVRLRETDGTPHYMSTNFLAEQAGEEVFPLSQYEDDDEGSWNTGETL